MRAGEAAHAAAIAQMKPGMTELDAFLVVQNAAIKELGERVIVYGDFASGPRTATDKGGPPTARKIESGDLLLLDFSVIVDGYRSDFTNTFAVGGGPTPRQRELFEACVGALKAAESKFKPGARGGDIDATIRAHFGLLGLADYFVTHSGHGIGLGHPEPPYLIPDGPETLVVGDIIAVEPGLYVEGIGGMRFERNYRITADGFETLSNHEIRIDQ
jgi:Xaa-Pro aminopeptidase